VASLPPEQLAALEEAAKASEPRSNKYLDAYMAREPRFPSVTQRAFLLANGVEDVLFGGAAGGGKALSLSTPLPTPSGWTTMGEVRAGDWLLDEAGVPCRVVATSEVMHGHRVYDVEFSDGSVIRADGGHLWWTQTVAERAALARRHPEWRAKRRAKRKLRGKGLKPWLAARNAARAAPSLPPPTSGSAKTTEAIAATLRNGKAGRLCHTVTLAGALQLPEATLPIPPYTLGVWLGDGTSEAGAITSADEEVISGVRADGFEVVKSKARYLWGTRGLAPLLRANGLTSNKHIPPAYLRASQPQRIALLQGLMDTDGTCGTDGRAEFTGCNRQLVEGVLELVLSLGMKATMCEGVAKLNGRVVGPKYRVSFHAPFPVFRLARKAARQTKPSVRCGVRYIVSVREVPSEPVKCVQVDSASHLYLAGRSFIPTHNSSALLGAALQYVDVPGYAAMLFRRTFMDLQQPDALVPRSHEWLSGTDAHWQGDLMQWRFPSGAVVKFGHLEHHKDVEKYQGAAAHFWGFDEAGQLEPWALEYLKSRARKPKGMQVPIRFRYSANPGGRAHEWLVENFVLGAPQNGRLFIPSKAVDNPGLDVEDYLGRMEQMSDETLKAQLINGDWGAMDRSGLVCPEWTPEVEAACTRPDYPAPSHFTAYCGVDVGGARDLFVMLWGYVDFVARVLVIIDERWFRNPRTEELGEAAVAVEAQHFAALRSEGRIDTTIRVTDIDARFVADLGAKPWHLAFTHVDKTQADMWERQTRTAIKQGRIVVHPRCSLLLRTLKYARYNDARTDYERNDETGHADAWKALVYLFRSVQWERNPFPSMAAVPGLPRQRMSNTARAAATAIRRVSTAL